MNEPLSEIRGIQGKRVHVVLRDGSIANLGTVLDLSLSGARIRFSFPIESGSKMELIFDEHQQLFHYTIIWTTNTEIGLSLDSPALHVLPSTTNKQSQNLDRRVLKFRAGTHRNRRRKAVASSF